MRKTVLAVFAALTLAACQTTGSTYSPDNKPVVVTTKSVAEAKVKAKAIFTGPIQRFTLEHETSNQLLFSKELPANVNDNNPLKARTKGKPLFQLELTFKPENGGTRVTGDIWMYLNPRGANKDKFNLLATPDGPRMNAAMRGLR